jgi:hypothetical protein
MEVVLAQTDSFRQGFETAPQRLQALWQHGRLAPEQQGAPHATLEGLAAALLAVKQACSSTRRTPNH